MSQQDPEGYLSDESDFYGDDQTVNDLETAISDTNIRSWWANKPQSLTALAVDSLAAAKEREKSKEKAQLFNPYEGTTCARQLGETVDQFLQRLPASTTPATAFTPWIFIANPFVRQNAVEGQNFGDEAPTSSQANWSDFAMLGSGILDELSSVIASIKFEHRDANPSMVSRVVSGAKEEYVQRILDAAKLNKCTSGKWMLFIMPSEVDTVWSVVAKATAQNDLGTAAKVAPDGGDDRSPRLICIYTDDFTNIEDLRRVLLKMKELGLVQTQSRPIYYKCDAFTHLQLNSGNEWGIKTSLYSSKEIFDPKFKAKTDIKASTKPKKTEKKLDSYFQRIKARS